MNWLEVLSTSTCTSLCICLIAFLAKEWISTRLKESIAAEYQKALESFKQRLAWEDHRRRQAIELADLFSLWLRQGYYPTEDENANRYELQKKYWELALWLDEPVLRAVHSAFQASGSPGVTHKQALIEVRRLVVNSNDTVTPDELFHFDPKPSKR